MAAVHYYLGRPARVWISAHTPRSPERQARTGSGRVHSGIPGQPATGLTPSMPAAAHGSPDTCPRSAGNPTSSVTAAPGLPPDAAPAGGLLARHRIAIARFGTDVAAAGGIGPALAAGLDPAGYPVVPAGVPQAWERAQVYLGLCERYQELYQAQLAELHLLMAMAPGCSLPLPHRRPLTAGRRPPVRRPVCAATPGHPGPGTTTGSATCPASAPRRPWPRLPKELFPCSSWARGAAPAQRKAFGAPDEIDQRRPGLE